LVAQLQKSTIKDGGETYLTNAMEQSL